MKVLYVRIYGMQIIVSPNIKKYILGVYTGIYRPILDERFFRVRSIKNLQTPSALRSSTAACKCTTIIPSDAGCLDIMNTNYQKLPFGSGDYSDKLCLEPLPQTIL